MIILGLDPGTAILGWGVIDTGPRHDLNQAKCLGYDCLITDKGMNDSQRLLALYNGLEVIMKQFTPDLVGVERLFFAKNQKTVMTVSQARGVILLQIERMGLPLVEYTPLQVKQALTDYGKAEKLQVQQMVKLVLKLRDIPKPDDAADALAIALTAAQAAGNPLAGL
jgi:crossover junction endodeoxyribonuclease RuvC